VAGARRHRVVCGEEGERCFSLCTNFKAQLKKRYGGVGSCSLVGWADLGRGVGCYGAGLLRWTGKAFPPFLISNFYLLFLFSIFIYWFEFKFNSHLVSALLCRFYNI
jgi:hypothetical protein